MCKHQVNLLRSTSKQQVLILVGNTVRLTAEGYRFEAEAGVAKDRFTLSFGELTAIEEVETDAEVRATTDGLHIRAAKAVHMSVCFSRVHPRRKDGNLYSTYLPTFRRPTNCLQRMMLLLTNGWLWATLLQTKRREFLLMSVWITMIIPG